VVGRESSGRFDDENEALAVDDFDASPRLQRQTSARTPNLPVDPHSSLFSVPRHRLALGAEQPLLAGDVGRRRDRSSIVSTSRNRAAVATVAAPTTESERVKPGAPEGNIMIAPITNATIPPTPMTPKEPIWASATIRPIPSSTSAAPA
jgi:hypothetical protein